jgi:hypothetical protein
LTWIVIPAYAGIQSSDWLDAGFRRHDARRRWPGGGQEGLATDRRHDEDIFAWLHPMQGVNASELWG